MLLGWGGPFGQVVCEFRFGASRSALPERVVFDRRGLVLLRRFSPGCIGCQLVLFPRVDVFVRLQVGRVLGGGFQLLLGGWVFQVVRCFVYR